MISKVEQITAGEMRHLVQVQRPSYVDDGSGGQETTWADHVQVWCLAQEKGSNEPYGDVATGRVRTKKTFVFFTWWRDDIVETDRLSWGGVLWNISCTENLQTRNKILKITADAGVEQ